MGVITNGAGGGAGGGIRYNAQTDMIEVKYNGSWVETPYRAYASFDGVLYDNGAQAVAWDNTGYARNSSYTPVGGATLTSGYFNFSTSGMSQYTNKCIITDNKVDLSGWNTLYIQAQNGVTSIDVSAINQMAYISVECDCKSGGSFYLNMGVSTEKTYYDATVNKLADVGITSGSGNVIEPIYKVWLE